MYNVTNLICSYFFKTKLSSRKIVLSMKSVTLAARVVFNNASHCQSLHVPGGKGNVKKKKIVVDQSERKIFNENNILFLNYIVMNIPRSECRYNVYGNSHIHKYGVFSDWVQKRAKIVYRFRIIIIAHVLCLWHHVCDVNSLSPC